MAMAVTAVPAMTSLACENAPQGYGATRSEVIDAFADSAEFDPTCEAHTI